ncbi:exo-alpha-sialidase [Kutzneria viridogrisea]|uniref:Sortilin N-terminal domain-containing protein n=2 Tax=Kutzneria TaxID=43356 RepID=W5W0G3_9PSEU|nr:glycosyl hydrolase [Kutzneria albida]AHH94648.1 hypothetical protein KALB_1275 [Kutzneria albida DSM 43870]MBA8930316.1 phage pi2 protein 07 [Kutzneria viridogrisea]
MADERTIVAIGTRKGLWLATSEDNRARWQLTGPHNPMTAVYAVAVDPRRARPRLLVGTTSEHFGPTVVTSDDLGRTWREPDQPPLAFPEDTGAALGRVWQLTPGPACEPEVVYAGVEPSALFRSEDGGLTYELVRGLWEHEHRPDWGAGYGGQAIHTVLPHPTRPESITVAMSTGGVYRSEDRGASWHAANRGIQAGFLPERYPEFGQCVHKVARHPDRPERFFLQNHGGVYRSEDDAASWQSIAEGLPSDFGFTVVVHPHQPDTVYTFPLIADENRFAPEGRCRVYRSEDAGRSWQALQRGLPEAGFYSTVLRDAMCTDDAETAGLYFGSRSGEVYASRDEGQSWQVIAKHLPDVLCVRAATV